MISMKLTGIIIAAKMPNARIGTISDRAFARNATHVVLDVTKIAPKARLKVKAILSFSSFAIYAWSLDCFQASQKTKMSSAAIPSTMKIVSWISVSLKDIWKTPP